MRTASQPDANHLMRRIRDMVAGGRIHAARPLLGALRKMAPPSAELSEIEARLLLREGRAADAMAHLDAGIALDGEAVGLRLCRVDARMQLNDVHGAAADAAEAVILDQGNVQAKAILGIVLIEMNQPADAVPCLRAAVAADPARAAYRKALATAQERSGDVPAAIATLDTGIRLNGGDVGLRTAAIMVAMRQRRFAHAADLAESAQRDGVADACVFGLRGHALSSIGRHQEAGDAYAEALKLAPEDPYVRHLVTAAGLLPQAPRAPAAYLATVFDGYAQRFEAHLIGLGYRVPGLIRSALVKHCTQPVDGERIGPVLDLGCGTGLMAVVLSDLPFGPLTGVDVSEGMLAEARANNLYETLEHADLEAVLGRTDAVWPLILAADVFCYFGALDDVLIQAHARLRPGGLLAFSVEEMAGEPDDPAEHVRGWRLGRQGRYAHRFDYVVECANRAGFNISIARREALRTEAEAAVPGILFMLERVRHDG